MVSKKPRILVVVIMLAAVWLFFLYERVIGELLTNGGIVILLTSTGTYFGARLLGLKFPK